jgi:hypothetical protein
LKITAQANGSIHLDEEDTAMEELPPVYRGRVVGQIQIVTGEPAPYRPLPLPASDEDESEEDTALEELPPVYRGRVVGQIQIVTGEPAPYRPLPLPESDEV